MIEREEIPAKEVPPQELQKYKFHGEVPKIVWIVLGAVLFTVILQGILRDGVTVWIPTYASETFSLPGETAILSGVLMPLFAIFSIKIADLLYQHLLSNELVCIGAMFSAGAVAALVLCLFFSKSAALSVFLSAVLVGCMHGTNLILTCIMPLHFAKYTNISMISGIINSCTHIGGAISTFGIAFYSQKFGWQATIALWAAISFGGAVLSLLFAKKWKSKVKE